MLKSTDDLRIREIRELRSPQEVIREFPRTDAATRTVLSARHALHNILLGTAHLTRLMEQFGNNLVLVAVAYNAGPGRVPQWIARNGDPRRPGTDVVEWIENIPFSETRNYVQRVVENAMVYDTFNPERSRSQGRISYYLGQRSVR